MTIPEPPSSSFSRAATLLQRYFEQSLTVEEAHELERYWEANPEFRLFAERNRETHRLLAFFSTLEDFSLSVTLENDTARPIVFNAPITLFSGDAFAFHDLVQMERDAPSLSVSHVAHVAQELQSSRANPRSEFVRKWSPIAEKAWRRFLYSAFTFVLLGVVVGLFLEIRAYRNARPSRRTVAHLMEMEKVVWENPGNAPRKGDAVHNGKLKLLDGLIAVKLIDGAEIVLEGPAEIEWISPSELKLLSGYLSADVPPQPEPLVITAGDMNVKVLGTAFWMRAHENRNEIHMLRGKVELSNPSLGRFQLDASEAFSILRDGASQRFAALDHLFVTRERLPQRAAVLGQNRFQQWMDNAEALDNRQDLLLRFDFEETENDRLANLSVTGKERIDGAEIVGARSAEGRWTQKRALQCDGRDDHVYFSLPGSLNAFTIFVSLRIDALDNDFNGILMSDESNPATGKGLVHWQITRDGSLRFGAGAPGSHTLVSSLSSKILGENNWGQWLRLAVTVDAASGRIQQYVNGRRVSGENVRIDFTPEIASASLGSRREEGQNKPRRGLRGAFDELMIFDRALSDTEIKKLSN